MAVAFESQSGTERELKHVLKVAIFRRAPPSNRIRAKTLRGEENWPMRHVRLMHLHKIDAHEERRAAFNGALSRYSPCYVLRARTDASRQPPPFARAVFISLVCGDRRPAVIRHRFRRHVSSCVF